MNEQPAFWLDLTLKKHLKQVIDWNRVDKEDCLSAMQRSPVKDIEIKVLLKYALTDQGEMKQINKDNAPVKIFAGGKAVAYVNFGKYLR